MSYRDIMEQVKATLSAVANIGNVYAYVPYSADRDSMIDLFGFSLGDGSPSHLRAWTISRVGIIEDWIGTEMSMVKHQMVLRGYLRFKDDGSSEPEFQDLIETVCDRFRPRFTLQGTSDITLPMQVEDISVVSLGGVLCHVVEITVEIEEALTYTVVT